LRACGVEVHSDVEWCIVHFLTLAVCVCLGLALGPKGIIA